MSELTDVLRALDTEQVVLHLNPGEQPGAVRSPGDPDYVYVVAPVQLRERAASAAPPARNEGA